MVVSMLSLVVVLTVFWQLRIVGISMTDEALCGKLDHTHTQECRVMQNVCGLEEAEGHSHTGECYTAETVQICQKEVHSHGDECQLKREQTCEQEEHRHGDVCVKTESVLICADESEGHVHTSESTTVTTQICTKEEHSHSDACQGAEESGCEQEEHQHGDACVKTEFVPACYEARTTQVCEMDEHTHVEGQCYVLTPCVCEKEEHQHEEACYETQDKLICGKEESEGHVHTPECQREVNGCGYEEEHKHTLMCYSNAEADVETSADWEASLPALSGNAREDLVAVANSQLGYAESERNYKVADDNATKMGYTRYGEWYGNPYGNWNAMFVSFCLNYSNHPDYAVLKNTGVETMRQAAISAGKYTAVEPDLVPAAGSVVFLDKDSSGSADRAAVVTYTGNGVISVVEGDHNGTVAAMEYSMSNGTIMGYALLPAREPQILTSPNLNSNHVQSTEDGYSLNYVCGCSGDHDVGASEYCATVELDQSLSELPVPTAAAVNDPSCENYGKTFIGWYVRNGETGEEVDFDADTLLTDDYLTPNTEDTINIYARWAVVPVGDTVTVTFVIDEETTEIVTLPTNDVLGDYYWQYEPCVDGLMLTCWQTEDGTVIYEDTPITADITLYPVMQELVMVIFELGEYMDMVETVDKQIPKGTALGEEFIELPDFAEITDKVFLGWVVKDSENTRDYLTAETVIYEDTTYVPVFGEMVTLTFMNGEGTSAVEFKVIEDIPLGATLWNYLPEETPEYTGTSEKPMVFSGWSWMNGESLALVTETTVAETDMVLYAVFEEVTSYKVYLHDMAPDGVTDYEGQNGPVTLYAEMTLQNYLESNPYRMHRDGKPAAECKWYIKQMQEENEAYAAYDLTAPVSTELHLYTFNYAVTLNRKDATDVARLMTANVDVNISQDGNTLTLTLREGEKPTAADFVVNGVDYTLYQWTYTEAGEEKELSISEIIANGVTENVTATSDGMMNLQTQEITVNFYVSVDDAWKRIGDSKRITSYVANGRYHLSAAQLESVYNVYGFTAADFSSGSGYLFAHTDAGGQNIYVCQPVELVDSRWFIPGLTHAGDVDIYYLPNKTISGVYDNKGKHAANNTFYPLTISDNLPHIYGADDEIPPVRYILTGETATVTLPDPAEDTTSWLVNGNPMPEGVSNGDGTTTYTFSNVTAPIRIVAYRNNRADISYDINLTGFTPDSTAPLINGAQTYTDSVQIQEDGSYIVRTPSRTQFTVVESNAQITVLFKGWAINGNSNMLLHAGDKLTVEQLKQYGSAINLTAQWEKQGYTKIVSFYVNLNLEVVDYNGDSIPVTSNDNYTSALYGTTLSISPEPTNGYPTSWGDGNYVGEGGGVVLTAEKSAEADALIRQFATQSISAEYGKTGDYKERTFTLASFPDDGQILEKIRSIQAGYIRNYETWLQSHPDGNVDTYRKGNKIIAVDGQYIPIEELTASNYTVRWVVFKYDDTNGWHIDGTLVKKQGQVTVKKTFFGYNPAVEEVTNPNRENPYSITVKDENGATVTTLILNNEDTANGKGYEAYDSATETYTWVIPLTADKTFTFFENNYASSQEFGGEQIASLAEYMVTNSASDVYRRTYDPNEGVSVKAKAHSVDQDYATYETVTFYNSYIPTAAVPISKVDDFGNSLPGVSFSLYRDNVKCNIYKDNAGIYYIYKPTDIEVSEVLTGYITVDKQGYALVMGLKDIDENDGYSGYTFKLEESVVPEGYASIEDIEFTIDHDGTIQLKNTMDSVKIVDGGVLRVTNASKTMDVTVVKKWEGQKEEVQVQLVQNGKPLTLKTATLNDANEWTYTWEDMPIYFGGELAEYSIKETWIGDTAYRGIYDDGYEGYIVVVSEPVVVDGDGDGLPESATITVNNSVYEGGVQFKKIDEKSNGLGGALFQLFTDEACTQVYGTGERSDLYGNVNFGHLVVGTYYMKEVRAPAGYQQNDTVYRITVTGSGTTLTVNGSETPISSIVNTPATASLKIRKVDGNNNPLTGATFKVQMLTDSENNTWEDVIKDGDKEFTVENSNGFLVIPELMPGDYKLIEITAPAGYYRRTEPILFSIVLSDISAYPNDDGWRVEVVKDDNGIVTDKYIVVENVPGSELPHTGGMGTTPVTMTGLFIMAASLYVFLLRRKREGRVE